MKYSDFYWKHNDCLNKDTSLAHSFGEKVWNHQQDEIDKLKKTIKDALCALESDAIGFSGLVHNYNKAEKILKGEEE